MRDELFFNLTEKEIEEFNPLTAARGVIKLLTELVDDLQGNGKRQFVEQFLKFVFALEMKARDLKKLDEYLPDFINQQFEVYAGAINTRFILNSTIFAVDAIKEFQAGRTQHAWILVLQAERYLGMAMGSNSARKIPDFVKSDQARTNATKNKKQRKYKKANELGMEYYKKNISKFSTMIEAAEKIAQIVANIQSVKVETIYKEWLPKFHEDNPSIKKPCKKN